jgi:hypothetical protein
LYVWDKEPYSQAPFDPPTNLDGFFVSWWEKPTSYYAWGAAKAMLGVVGPAAAVEFCALGTAAALELDFTRNANNIFKVISRAGQWGFRLDKAHHGKGWGHPEFWRW